MTVVDLFSGCGGFSQGFYLAGFDIICAIDHWITARNTIQMNHGTKLQNEPLMIESNYDIEKISKLPDSKFNAIIPDSDIIIGSPPCVSFSNSNRSGNVNKDLGKRLIEAFWLIVARKKDKKGSILKYWIMENVPRSEQYIQDQYEFIKDKNGYEGQRKKRLHIEDVKANNSAVYDSSEYGVPSKRLRYICGHFEKPNKVTNNLDELKLGSILKAIKQNGQKMTQDPVWKDLELETDDITDHGYERKLAEWEWKKAKRQKRDKGYMGQMSFPENENAISRTIMSFGATASREAFILRNKRGFRAPTIREYATLMSFPLNYDFAGVSHNVKQKQIGNAVPPKFSYQLATAIRKRKKPILRRLRSQTKKDDDFVDLKKQKFEKRIEIKSRNSFE